jgi:hypothetical protein
MGIDRNLDGVLDGAQPAIAPSIRLLNAGEAIELTWTAGHDHTHAVEYSDTLEPGSWVEAATNIVAQDGVARFVDIPTADRPARFYRIRRD